MSIKHLVKFSLIIIMRVLLIKLMEMKREAKINKHWGSEINRINYGVGVKNLEIIILNY